MPHLVGAHFCALCRMHEQVKEEAFLAAALFIKVGFPGSPILCMSSQVLPPPLDLYPVRKLSAGGLNAAMS